MRTRVVLAVTAALLGGLFSGIQPAGAAPHGALCHIKGKATFSKPLGQKPRPVTYSFTGKLDNCGSSTKGYSSAAISATGSGKLSCGQGSSTGVATVTWKPSNRTSTVKYSTTSFAALVDVQGKVTKGQFKGDPSQGALIFEARPQDCFGKGVRSAGFDGADGYGNYK